MNAAVNQLPLGDPTNGQSDGYSALIGHPPTPRSSYELPPSGVVWNGSVEFLIRQEGPGAFRWVLASGDGRQLELAKSASVFPSSESCAKEVEQIEPGAKVTFEN